MEQESASIPLKLASHNQGSPILTQTLHVIITNLEQD